MRVSGLIGGMSIYGRLAAVECKGDPGLIGFLRLTAAIRVKIAVASHTDASGRDDRGFGSLRGACRYFCNRVRVLRGWNVGWRRCWRGRSLNGEALPCLYNGRSQIV